MTLHPQARALLDGLPAPELPDLATVDEHRAEARAAALAAPGRIALEHVQDLGSRRRWTPRARSSSWSARC